jgi:hypothetical protein
MALKTLLFAFLICSFNSTFAGIAKRITFNVNMSSIGLKSPDTVLNVGIKGNVAALIFKHVLNELEWEGEEVRSVALNSKVAETVNHSFRFVKQPDNPFKKFMGEWTLKNDNWEQGDGKQVNEQIKLPDHYTLCKEVNTGNSMLWTVEATSAKGHIMWVYNTEKKEINWVSSFYPARSGAGSGSINENGDVRIKVTFEGEPAGTYRIYNYTWINDNEYVLRSLQYNDKEEPTGSFYGGTFVRTVGKTKN